MSIILSKEFYDTSGRFIGNETFDDNGNMTSKHHREFDNKGRCVLLENYTSGVTGSTGTLIYRQEMEFGATAVGATADVNNYDKLITERIYGDGINVTNLVTFTYCEDGSVLTKTVNGVCTTFSCCDEICPNTGNVTKIKYKTVS